MSNTMFTKFVALGDSFTEGVGDLSPDSPNGVLGWADRTAYELARTMPDLGYANLAIRGHVLAQVIDAQLEPALAMQPDLVAISAGGNDILRPSVDLDSLMERYDSTIAQLAGTGARVIVFTTFDGSFDALYKRLRGRAATYNEYLRGIADDHGAEIVDFWRMKDFSDRRMWSADRLHLNEIGHTRMAAEVLDVIGVPHALRPPPFPPPSERTRGEIRREDLEWTRDTLIPWIGRRIRGISTGDGLPAKYADLFPAAQLPVGQRELRTEQATAAAG
ncbi:SGNH/GDSL hydrolase family protein [Antrihabitans sp. YC3-6]|uniref:SGNH/GDSL hydrolase family protein n=1 Tax=Antrihabitans stalagmiti TaxID=2799499 RepID=A0A934NVT9_9NOCA|nr:SGNH/GDSL hydrolase family protein [Antrihabitans stalagmiti]MBJ8342504.1 SGNH/GDSL hydrolase family protein [Antrihabitans stalagmiti]